MTPKSEEEIPIPVRVGYLERDMTRVLGILEGRQGTTEKGLKVEFGEFVTWIRTRDEERKIYEGRQEKKSNLIIALGMLILTALLAFFTWVGTRNSKEGLLHSENPTQTASEDATAR